MFLFSFSDGGMHLQSGRLCAGHGISFKADDCYSHPHICNRQSVSQPSPRSGQMPVTAMDVVSPRSEVNLDSDCLPWTLHSNVVFGLLCFDIRNVLSLRMLGVACCVEAQLVIACASVLLSLSLNSIHYDLTTRLKSL